jgi:hypothetical protein
MPDVLRVGKYRFYFWSGEGQEPPHIHVESAEKKAKIWLQPLQLAYAYNYRSKEIKDILTIVRIHQHQFLEAWNEHFQ